MKKVFPISYFISYTKILYLFISLLFVQPTVLFAQTFPINFAGVQVATGLDPVGIDVAPDGRVFVAEKNGTIRIIKNGVLLASPFAVISNVDNWNERGLLKVLLDPNFSTNNYLYAYYTFKASGSTESNNRVSRFTANGDVVVAASEVVLIDIDPLGPVGYHNGGGLGIKNGQLYISIGENAVTSNSQSLTTLKGKVLRINTDGSIPTDNPFYTSATGKNRAIWALGFRNPFRLSIQPGTGKVFVNDVGASNAEEINEIAAGKNYGWPGIEGMRTTQTPPANYQDPVYAYNHSTGCSITAGQFYNPTTVNFPATYIGKYFFGDYCNGWLKTFDPTTGAVATFATGINRPLDVAVSSDGTLYFIARGGIAGGSDAANTSSTNGVVWKVNFTGNGIPVIAVQPANKTVSVTEPVTFVVLSSGNPAPTYQWQRNGVNITGATSTSYSIATTSLTDDGDKFKVVVTNSEGGVTSTEATLTVLNNVLPVATITTPVVGTKYSGGDVITFSGTGTDAEDGTLPASAFTWKIDLYHYDTPTHTHPALEPTNGSTSGTFTIPTQMETSPHVLFRIYLTVRDADGASNTVFVEINPYTSITTLVTSPAGLTVKLDGSVVTAPSTFEGARNIQREIEAPQSQTMGGLVYIFSSWSDGGARAHTISTPANNTTLTANFILSTPFVAGVYKLEPQHALGQRLDVAGAATGNQGLVNISTDNTNASQRWLFIDKGNGMYELEPQHAIGKRLDVSGASNANGAKVETYTSNGGANQLWKLIDMGGGIYELEPQCAIGKRLEMGVFNTVVSAISSTANNTNSQRWRFIPLVSTATISGVDNSGNNQLSNYPNPFNSETTIVFEKPMDCKQAVIRIYKTNGQLLKEIDVIENVSGTVKISSGEFQSGEYVYNFFIDGKSIATKRFVVVH